MKTICTYALFFVFLAGCLPVGEKTGLVFKASEVSGEGGTTPVVVGANREQSMKAFEETVYPIVRGETCVSCHNSSIQTKQSPFFADPTLATAFDAITQTGKVNLVHPEDSRIVAKLKEKHNCWTASCDDDSNIMLEAIKRWAVLAPPGSTGSITTVALQYPSTLAKAQTEYGTIILQAEQEQWKAEVQSGRFLEAQDSLASEGKFLEFPVIDPHPRQATRRLDIAAAGFNSCREFNATDSSSTDQARAIKIIQQKVHNPSETIRGPGNQIVNDGHIPKVAKLQFNIVRPDKRLDYAKMLVSGDFSQINNALLTSGLADNVTRAVGVPLGTMGNDLVLRRVNAFVLPKFVNHGTVFDASGNFKPGASLHTVFETTFAETPESIRANLSTPVHSPIKKNIMYPDLKNFMKGVFYDGNNALRTDIDRGLNYAKYLNADLQTMFSRDVSVKYICPLASCTSNQIRFSFTKAGPVLTQNNALDCYTLSGDNFVQASANMCDGTNRAYFHFIDLFVFVTTETPVVITRSENLLKVSGSPDAYSDLENFADGARYVFLNDTATSQENPDYLFTGGLESVSEEDKKINFGETTHMVLKGSLCMSCHGNSTVGAPQFASVSLENSYQVLKAGNYINFGNVNASFRADLVAHCEARRPAGNNTNCAALAASLYSSITAWGNKNAEDAVSNGAAKFKTLSTSEKLPGRVKYTFNITEAGDYNFWARFKNSINGAQTISYQIKRVGVADAVMGRLGSNGGNAGRCRQWAPTTSQDMWDWTSPGRDGEVGKIDSRGFIFLDNNKNPEVLPDQRIYYALTPGEYVLDIIGLTEGMKIDMVALNRVSNPTVQANRLEFQPDKRSGDYKNISDYKRRILKYDLSSALGLPADKKAFFEIEVKKEFDNQNYIFRAPRFYSEPENSVRMKMKGIKVLINGKWNYPDASYNVLEAVVGDNKVVTYAPLVALIGGNGDQISFAFDTLEVTNDPLTALQPNGSIAAINNDMHCNDLDFFVRNVKPILRQTKVMLKSEMNEFLADYPGRPREEYQEPQAYNCITCHTANHPYFKMNTFSNDDEFCREALNRVDFTVYRQSLVIRGINGIGNHPKFVFVEKFVKSGDNFKIHNRNLDYESNYVVSGTANDPSNPGIASEIMPGPMLKWTWAEIQADPAFAGLSAAQKTAAKARSGMLKRLVPRRINMAVVNYDWFVPEVDNRLLFDPNNQSQLDNILGAFDVITPAANGDIDDQRRGPIIYDVQGIVSGVPATSNLGDRNGTIPLKGNTRNFRAGAVNGFDRATIDYDSTTPATDPIGTMDANHEALRDYYRETVIEWIRREDALR